MTLQPMSTAPKDRPILVKAEGYWIEANWQVWYAGDEGRWVFAKVSSHGCGCCGNDVEEADMAGWMELPE